MKIATWNLQRLDKNKTPQILDKLVEINADIFVLTETNVCIKLNNYFCVSTDILPTDYDETKYKAGETRVSILTKYNTTTRHQTFDNYTTVCNDIETPFGSLTVYGTIIGVFSNRQPRFDNDLKGQVSDFEKIFPGKQICIAGDFNTMFADYVYPSHKARNTLNDTFKQFALTNTTATIVDNVDHIVLSDSFIKNKKVNIDEVWNKDKKLSDHIGLCLTLTQS